MSLNDTPRGERLHIGIFGKRNSGKSSLLNAITGHETALVSDYAGTTADPVYKSMEIHGIGPCVFIDTAGFDDQGEIGGLRVELTRKAVEKTEIAIVVLNGADNIELETEWIEQFKKKGIPIILVLNKSDIINYDENIIQCLIKATGIAPIIVSAVERSGITALREALLRNLPEDFESKTITGDQVKTGDSVLLVMPQDIQAPKGRLILPQVQTLRELLDKQCIVTCITAEKIDQALSLAAKPPNVIITDSQLFKIVYDKKPKDSKLTSFSVLFAGLKGDLDYYATSALAIGCLTEQSKVLIAEACTHAPLTEDIGREKIPNMLRKAIGQKLLIDMVSGTDFPEGLTDYSLIIQCGACMFNRKYVMSRIEKAKEQHVPMTNYGIAIAYLTGILDQINLS